MNSSIARVSLLEKLRLLHKPRRVLGRDFRQRGKIVSDQTRHHQKAHVRGCFARENLRVAAVAHRPVDQAKRLARVGFFQRADEGEHEFPPGRAEHLAHEGSRNRRLCVAQAHIQQRQRVAHAALGGGGDFLQRVVVGLAADAVQDDLHARDDQQSGNALEIISLAAGKHRGRKLLRLRRGQYEHGVGGRLLQRFQKRVERAGGQHVHLVDDVHLVLAHRRRVDDSVAQKAHLVYAVVAGGVDFEHVHRAFILEFTAYVAFAARLAVHRTEAVHGARQHLGRGGLAGSAAAAE